MIAHKVYSMKEVASISGATLLENDASASYISELLTDSRKLANPSSSIFFAIRGDRNNGHNFIQDLYDAGVRNFVVEKDYSNPESIKANFIFAEKPLKVMQQLAAYHRQQFSIPVIGVTGSNGKTIVKEWLYQLLREDYHVVRSPKSYNSQVGVPLSVWQMSTEDSLGIFEAGISMPGEMICLHDIIQPTIGIFLNIGQAHDENFKSESDKISEKLQLFGGVEKLIYCKDYPGIHSQVTEHYSTSKIQFFSWSRKSKADLQIGRISRKEHEAEIQGIYNNDFISIRIPFTDDASIENAIHCWALMLLLKIEMDVIQERMELLSPVAMRLEMKEGLNNCSIINDSYNSDLGSLTIALDFLNQQKQHARRTVILSDILQSGRDESALYRQVNDLLKQKQVDRLIGIGPAISRQSAAFTIDAKFFTGTDEFLNELNYGSFVNESVLIKGARSFGFERISKALQQKAHETVLEINLNAVVHNLNLFRSRLRNENKLMVMVKAFSYGSGSFEIANTLQFHRADYLAVAYADEGVELRKAGITLPIMVMNPEEQSFDAMISYRLEPEIYSFRILNQFTEALRRRNDLVAGTRIPVHIEFDTGMKRLGFEEQELNELVIRLKNNKHLKVVSVFSHMVASDESVHDTFTKEQIERFKKMSEMLQSHFSHPIMRHLLNSSGILRFPEAQFEMVRLGIGLHGIASSPQEQRQLQMVATLKTTISQIRQVKAGETIGYSRKGVAEKDMTLATVGIGYADGFNRRLGNGVGKVLVMGHFAPVVGSVCMDMTMIDITGITAREGTEVIVFGADHSILDIAKQIETIPYEVLTSVSERVKRVYFHE
jgi:Alr-MurF fusion protein